MYDFSFSVPTEIYFGKDCERKAGTLMKQWAERVLLLYGSDRIFECEKKERAESLGDGLIKSLKAAGCGVFPLGGVRPNPDGAWIDKAIQIVRKEQIQGILAVGGGSVIDAAKAISAGCCFPGSTWELYSDPSRLPEMFLPVGAVVTIPATASESNGMSVISHSQSGKKIARCFPEIRPKFALLNPELTITVSAFQTACGGFDIFSHAFERYFDLRRESLLLDRMCETVMKLVIEILPQILEEPWNTELRGELMLAATMAHNDMLGPGGDFACHEMSHIITEKLGVPHGGALAMIIPHWCKMAAQKKPERLALFFEKVWEAKGDTRQHVIDDGIDRMVKFIQSAGLPLHSHIPMDDSMLRAMAEETIGPEGFVGWGCFPLDLSDVEMLYRRILT